MLKRAPPLFPHRVRILESSVIRSHVIHELLASPLLEKSGAEGLRRSCLGPMGAQDRDVFLCHAQAVLMMVSISECTGSQPRICFAFSFEAKRTSTSPFLLGSAE